MFGSIDINANYCVQKVARSQSSGVGATAAATAHTPGAGADLSPAPLDELLTHQAGDIAWRASSTSSLTPTPPSLHSEGHQVQIQTWIAEVTASSIAGEAASCIRRRDSNDGTSHLSDADTRLFWFFGVGMPIIGACIVGFLVWWWCIRPYKKRKRRARERLAADEAVAAAAAAGSSPTETANQTNAE